MIGKVYSSNCRGYSFHSHSVPLTPHNDPRQSSDLNYEKPVWKNPPQQGRKMSLPESQPSAHKKMQGEDCLALFPASRVLGILRGSSRLFPFPFFLSGTSRRAGFSCPFPFLHFAHKFHNRDGRPISWPIPHFDDSDISSHSRFETGGKGIK